MTRTTSGAEYRQRGQTSQGTYLLLAVLIVGGSLLYFVRGSKAIDSVAVLPFVNAVLILIRNTFPTASQPHHNLSRVPRIEVIARSSVFRYKRRETDARAARA